MESFRSRRWFLVASISWLFPGNDRDVAQDAGRNQVVLGPVSFFAHRRSTNNFAGIGADSVCSCECKAAPISCAPKEVLSDTGLSERVNFHQRHAGRSIHAAHNGRVVTGMPKGLQEFDPANFE
jgi:hypothetical protein